MCHESVDTKPWRGDDVLDCISCERLGHWEINVALESPPVGLSVPAISGRALGCCGSYGRPVLAAWDPHSPGAEESVSVSAPVPFMGEGWRIVQSRALR